MSQQNNPPVTVLMSVYNVDAYLAEAVESILNQTFPHFRFLIIDDASTDGTAAILAGYADRDSRVTIITNERNLGLTASLNKGLERISTPYVARMDADDVSLPERLEKQLAYMEGSLETAALGGWVETVDAAGAQQEHPWFTDIRRYRDSTDIRKALLLGYSVLVHPTAMLRTASLRSIGGYRVCFRYAQDYDLYLRLLPVGNLQVLPEVLLRYRVHDRALSSAKLQEQRISNAAALGSALIRERGEADPLEDCTQEIDYNQLVQLANAAGTIAWLRWLELNSYGMSSLTCEELHAISGKIASLAWPGMMFEDRPPYITANELWLAWMQGKVELAQNKNSELQQYINSQHQQIDSLQRYIDSQCLYIEGQKIVILAYEQSKSWRLTAPLRKLVSMLRVLKRGMRCFFTFVFIAVMYIST